MAKQKVEGQFADLLKQIADQVRQMNLLQILQFLQALYALWQKSTFTSKAKASPDHDVMDDCDPKECVACHCDIIVTTAEDLKACCGPDSGG